MLYVLVVVGRVICTVAVAHLRLSCPTCTPNTFSELIWWLRWCKICLNSGVKQRRSLYLFDTGFRWIPERSDTRSCRQCSCTCHRWDRQGSPMLIHTRRCLKHRRPSKICCLTAAVLLLDCSYFITWLQLLIARLSNMDENVKTIMFDSSCQRSILPFMANIQTYMYAQHKHD